MLKLEQGEWEVVALDADGNSIAGQTLFDSRKEAKVHAKRLLNDRELVESGMHKIEVRNHKGECYADYFVEL